MAPIFANPRLAIVLCLVGLLVLGINFTLFNLLRGKRPLDAHGSAWSRALGVGRQAQRQQTADYDRLHQAVAALQSKPDDSEQPDE